MNALGAPAGRTLGDVIDRYRTEVLPVKRSATTTCRSSQAVRPPQAGVRHLAVCTGQRRGELPALKREQLTDEGIIFRQSKTGAGVLIEWSNDMQAIVARAKAVSPQIPADYLIRKRDGRRYTEDGFSAIWQCLIAKHVKAAGTRFSFHDLRSVSAAGAATPAEARARLGHASVVTIGRDYLRGLSRASRETENIQHSRKYSTLGVCKVARHR